MRDAQIARRRRGEAVGLDDRVPVDQKIDAEVRVYSELFSDPAPDGADKDFLACMNPDSLETLTGCKVEARMRDVAAEYDKTEKQGKTAPSFQFMRLGYFCLDNKDCSADHLVFNRSVTLKDSFKV